MSKSAPQPQAVSFEPFYRLVKLYGRAFYDDITTKGDNQAKSGRGDNRGMAVVVLDALTRRQWVKEEDLAKQLKLHSKQLRRTLRFFEEEKVVTRDHRRENAKGAKVFSSAVAAAGDGQIVKEGEEKLKIHTHSYCCLDYAQILDVVRYRLHRVKKKLKDELDSRNSIQEYICPNCARRYSAFDALQLVSLNDEYFHCENCNGELVAESDKIAAEEMGDGDDNARRRRREKLKDMLHKMERIANADPIEIYQADIGDSIVVVDIQYYNLFDATKYLDIEQLKPLQQQLLRVKDLTPPEFGTLQAWEAKSIAASHGNGDSNANDPFKPSHGQGYSGTPMPLAGETRVEVSLTGLGAKEENTESDTKPEIMKVLPPWMIKKGMNLTKEQRGEVKPDMKMEQSSNPVDEKKPKVEKEDEKRQGEYLLAYYAAYAKMQEEAQRTQQAAVAPTTSVVSNSVNDGTSEHPVGMKAKRDDDGDDDTEWEEGPSEDNAGQAFKLADLNVQADASEDEEDDIDWEEG